MGDEWRRRGSSWVMRGEGGEGVGGGQEVEAKLGRMRWRRSKNRQKTRRIPAKTQWLPWGATG